MYGKNHICMYGKPHMYGCPNMWGCFILGTKQLFRVGMGFA